MAVGILPVITKAMQFTRCASTQSLLLLKGQIIKASAIPTSLHSHSRHPRLVLTNTTYQIMIMLSIKIPIVYGVHQPQTLFHVLPLQFFRGTPRVDDEPHRVFVPYLAEIGEDGVRPPPAGTAEPNEVVNPQHAEGVREGLVERVVASGEVPEGAVGEVHRTRPLQVLRRGGQPAGPVRRPVGGGRVWFPRAGGVSPDIRLPRVCTPSSPPVGRLHSLASVKALSFRPRDRGPGVRALALPIQYIGEQACTRRREVVNRGPSPPPEAQGLLP